MVPDKGSRQWTIVFIIYSIVTLICFIITRAILGSDISSFQYVLILLFLSLVSSFIPCIGGYLGKKTFFVSSTVSVIYANIYNFQVVIEKTASGWEELATIVGFIFIVGAGTVISIVAEVIAFLIRYFRKR